MKFWIATNSNMPEGDFQSFVVYLDETKIDEISQLLDISGDFIQNFDAASRRLNLGSTGVINSAQTEFDTGTGFFLGNDEGVAKFSIGDSDGDKVTWDGSSLNITGGFTVSSISTSESGRRIELSDTLDSLIVYDGDGNPTTALKAVIAFPTLSTITDATLIYGVGTYMVDRDTAYIVWTDHSNLNVHFSKTTDGGDNYSALAKIDDGSTAGTNPQQARRCVYASDANTAFVIYKDTVASDLHLAKTTDGGSNWTLSQIHADIAAGEQHSQAIIGTSSSNLFVIWYSENDASGDQIVSFTKSTDGGDTWSTPTTVFKLSDDELYTAIPGGVTPNALLDMTVIDDDNIWVMVSTLWQPSGFGEWYSTNDGGATWTYRDRIGLSSGSHINLSIDAVSVTEIYSTARGASDSHAILYKSTGGNFTSKATLTGLGNRPQVYAPNTNNVFVVAEGSDGTYDFWAASSTDGGTTFGAAQIQDTAVGTTALHGISEQEMIFAMKHQSSQHVYVSLSQGVDIIHLANVTAPSIPPATGTYLYSKSGEQYTMDSSGNETLNS
jgi:hypothetical protein